MRSCGIGGSRSAAALRYASGPIRRFFAHSISVARSPAGRNLYAPGRRLPSWRSGSAFDGRIPPTASGAKWRSWRSAAEWNVPARTRCTPSAARRARSSPPALSVNVTAMISSGAERAGRNLLRDAPRDRRRLPGSGAGEDADRPAHRLGGTPLFGVQAFERVHPSTVTRPPAGSVTAFRQLAHCGLGSRNLIVAIVNDVLHLLAHVIVASDSTCRCGARHARGSSSRIASCESGAAVSPPGALNYAAVDTDRFSSARVRASATRTHSCPTQSGDVSSSSTCLRRRASLAPARTTRQEQDVGSRSRKR